MFKLVQYFKFLLTATNEHGVHSPFIYRYVTKCLYEKHGFGYSKSISVLLKSIAYFDVKQLWLPEKNEIQKIVHQHFPDVRFGKKTGKILWISKYDPKMILDLLSKENDFQNDSILFFDAIHVSKENYKTWEKVKMHDKVTVTVDMFFCGVVFFRKEQAKEHFKIRI